MTSTEVRELAGKTAAEIRRRGWHTGRLVGRGGLENCTVCAISGIAAAAYGNPGMGYELKGTAIDLAATVADRVHPNGWTDPYEAIYIWNDAQAGSADAVLAVFDRIAAGQ